MVIANTYSIVARCERTGALGVAVATAVPGVGALCPFVRVGAGAVATQSWVNPYLALDALAIMAGGADAETALAAVLAGDGAPEVRQVGVVDVRGGSAAHTGDACTPWCGHLTAPGLSIQGNMLTGPEVLDAMAAAYHAADGEDLPGRLMAALLAGDAAGGDKRGKQSAALLVHDGEDYPFVSLRVDEHPEPVAELARVLAVARLQLLPFVGGLPRRGAPAGPVPDAVKAMLALAPPDRPGGGGSAPKPALVAASETA
ncbi:DUF1028 domain-containing protein [Chthonobacter albigriseus]|uniref:DUF1028 domain-containing protein n=1 Tax=Chthonobacter albigriseus TaxID=1683161 RepID=UPI0015EF494E|nr:DUF1028 domain-containing protein [Chthonobacter albigriseus]